MTLDFEKSETGALLRNVRAFAAALEREKIAERTQRGKRARVASGSHWWGRSPLWLRWADAEKSRLIRDPATAPVVRRIFDLALDGMSLRGICTAMERDAIPSPGGNVRWTAHGVVTSSLAPHTAARRSPIGIATNAGRTGRTGCGRPARRRGSS